MVLVTNFRELLDFHLANSRQSPVELLKIIFQPKERVQKSRYEECICLKGSLECSTIQPWTLPEATIFGSISYVTGLDFSEIKERTNKRGQEYFIFFS